MPEASPLAAWESFYVIVGSSSAALTGLVFIGITFIAELRRESGAPSDAIGAFSAPTLSHLVLGLVLSAILSAPWQSTSSAGFAVSATGLFGVLYAIVVLRRMRRQKDYKPVGEDWAWYLAIPASTYAVIFIAGMLLQSRPASTLFFIAAATLMLVVIGIRNAWDSVAYVAAGHLSAHAPKPAPPISEPE